GVIDCGLTGMSGTLSDAQDARVRHYAYLPSGGVRGCKARAAKELRREGDWANGVGKGGQKKRSKRTRSAVASRLAVAITAYPLASRCGFTDNRNVQKAATARDSGAEGPCFVFT